MSRAVKQPVGQKRLTNVAVVRLKKAGKRFEIACYRNKVGDWRAGIERDLDEVLQTTAVFASVGKGVMAAKEDLLEAFGTADEEAICLEILAKGELQVGDRERAAQHGNLFKDVAGVLAAKTVNPDSGRPYTLTMLERALRDVHFNPDPKKSAKQQALEALPTLQARFPIQRARMRLRLLVPPEHEAALLAELSAGGSGAGGGGGMAAAAIESVERPPAVAAAAGAAAAAGGAGLGSGGDVAVVAQVDPGAFRALDAFMADVTARRGRVEVLSFAVTAEGSGAAEFNALPASAAPAAAAFAATTTEAAAAAGEGGGGAAAASAIASISGRPAAVPGAGPPRGRLQQQRAGLGAANGAAAAAGAGAPSAAAAAAAAGRLLYARGPVTGLPDEFASRRERFAELDALQAGWAVELRARGETVDAAFFSPAGELVGTFATARRQALAASKAAAAGGST